MGCSVGIVVVWVTLLSAVGWLVFIQLAARISRTEWRALLVRALESARDICGFIQTFVHTRDVPA